MRLFKSPVFLFVLSLASGIFLQPGITAATTLIAAGTLLAFMLLWVAKGKQWRELAFMVACCIGMTGIGSALGDFATRLPDNHISHSIGRRLNLRGLVTEGSIEGKSTFRAVLDCEGDQSGKIMLRAPKNLGELPHHSRIEAEVWVQYLPKNNDGYAGYLRSQGIHAIGQVANWEVVEKVEGFGAWITDLRASISNNLRSNMIDSEMSGLASAMFIGDKQGLSGEIRSDFSATGLSHILSISGMHVTIFYLFLNQLLAFMGRRLWSNRFRTFLILGILILYMALTGFSPAVCRAVLMLSLIKLSETFFLEVNTFNILSITAFVLLLINPALAFDLGFQLSFLAVAGLILLSPKFDEMFTKRAPWMPKWMKSSLCATLAAQLTTTPLIVYHFEAFPAYFILANLILLPLVTVATNVGIAAVLLGWIPGLGMLLGYLLDSLLWLISWGSSLFAKMPGAVVSRASFSDPGFCILFLTLAGLTAMIFSPEIKAALSWMKKRTLNRPTQMKDLSIG